ncbi:MAG: hypothetical protein Alpg2KO_08920 [Alphaproteobacteria bacterium]
MPHPYQDKFRPSRALTVLKTRHHADGRFVDLWLERPKDLKLADMAGLGIPASLSKRDLAEISDLLVGACDPETTGLLPRNGLPMPNLAAPTDDFLGRLLKQVSQHAPASDKGKRLRACLANPERKAQLQANYSVIDLLSLFPRMLSEQDLLQTLPPEAGSKTYTVDSRPMTVNGKPALRLSIAQEDGPAFHALFGEASPMGNKPGQASSYLRQATVGDRITIMQQTKGKPLEPAFHDPARPILLIAQGNAMIKMLPILEHLRQSRRNIAGAAPVTLIGAFQTEADILELEELSPYLADGTVQSLHLCLSREPAAPSRQSGNLHVHMGGRVQKLMAQGAISFDALPHAFICGGRAFCRHDGSVGHYVRHHLQARFPDQAGTDDPVQTSSSPDRRADRQGQSYPPLRLNHNVPVL